MTQSKQIRKVEIKEENSANSICESCGKVFSCGANTEKCWCFAVDVKAEILAELQKDFKSCLCADCLEKSNNK